MCHTINYYYGVFQFTHPGRGATSSIIAKIYQGSVSIHAPREGCDLLSSAQRTLQASFNSRTPGGVRLVRHFYRGNKTTFQFTHPGRGATALVLHRLAMPLCFNSRTPGGVRRARDTATTAPRPRFNSRTPGGVRLTRRGLYHLSTCCFNSRTPGGVRHLGSRSSSTR